MTMTAEHPESTKHGEAGIPTAVEWGRHAAVAFALAALAFMQDPGRIVADTKIDLALNPYGLLDRALSLWEPLGFAGQVQNQGYGYLFPMGPFFLLGDIVGFPDWVWQRLWWALVLFSAYLGTYLLAKALGIGGPGTRLVGALAFALAPRMLSTIGAISSESLAMALAPWVVLPLVWACRDGRLARGGLLSGVALLLAGGVNAAATLVLCIPPALYLLTRSPGAPKRRLAGWWALGTFLACAWWLGPLVILRQVSPPFLDYIENAAVTTRFASLPQAIRGAEHWLAFVADSGGPVWRSGWFLVTVPIVIAYTVIVASMGLAGLSLRGMPERVFVVALALAGVVLVTWGYVGPLDGILSETARGLLDGPLAAFRNTHKFDPVLRLALVMGVIHLLSRTFSFARDRPGWGVVPYAVTALAVLGTLGTAFPALVGQLAPRGSFVAVPGYWEEAVDFLEAATEDGGRALLVPGTPFATYLWGSPRDEPIQALGDVPWLVRDAIPLTPPATIRMLDALQARWASGRPSPGLANQLAAAGVKYLVIRNDLDTSLSRAPAPSVVHEALRGATGLSLVADFGPLVGGQLDDGAVVDRGLSQPYRAIEVYEVEAFDGIASTVPLDTVPVVAGGPENVVDLRDAGIIDAAPSLLDGDGLAVATGPLVQTDGIARRESTPGRVDDNASHRLAADEPGVLGRKVMDYRAFEDERGISAARWTGDGVITASSAASQADSLGGTRRSAAPFAALDADLFTSWWSAQGSDDQPWWMVEWSSPRSLPALRISMDGTLPSPRATAITVTTTQGEREYAVPDDGIVEVPALAGTTTMLRIASVGDQGSRLGIREILGLLPERRTAVVPTPSREPVVTSLSASVDGRPWCVHPPGAVICTDLIGRAGEEDGALDRVVTVPAGDPLRVELTAVPRPGTALDSLIAGLDAAGGASMTATASSSVVADPEGGPRAAIDRDLETAWIAGDRDDDPRLALRWGSDRPVAGIQLRQRLGLPASRPLSIAVQFPDGEIRSGRFDDRGLVMFDEPVRTSSLVVRFPEVQQVYSVDPTTGTGTILPVGVSDLRVIGAVDVMPDPTVSQRVQIPCGEGPSVALGDVIVSTSGTSSTRDLVQSLPVTFAACGDSAREANPGGEVRVIATGGDRWSVRQLVLGDVDAVDQAQQSGVTVQHWGATERDIAVGDRATHSLLVVRENASPGWAAFLNGEELPVARPDGWQQGWIVPPGDAATIELRMQPAAWYRAWLIFGLACSVALLTGAAMAVARTRRAPTQPRIVVDPARFAVGAQWSVVFVALVVAGGVWGAVACGISWAVSRWLPPRARLIVPVIVATLTLASGTVLALGPWTGGYAGDDLGAALPVMLALALAAAPWVDRRLPA